MLHHQSPSVLDDVEKAGKQLRPLEAFGRVVADEHFPACVLCCLAELEKLKENNKLEVEDFLDGTRAEFILPVGGEPHVGSYPCEEAGSAQVRLVGDPLALVVFEDAVNLLRRRPNRLLSVAEIVQELLCRFSAVFRRDASSFAHVVVRVDSSLSEKGVHRNGWIVG